MQNERVKASATPYAGYRYQTLFGVHLLVDWLEAPASYVRMRFECDDKSIGPQGLDDIVAERSDGSFDYYQVKYTPPEAASGCVLTWDWLLNPSSGGEKPKSFIQKWAKALKAISADCLGTASLVTNRTPDREVEDCLRGPHLDFDLAPSTVQERLKVQLGGDAAARAFLQSLQIRHSQHAFLRLEAKISDRLGTLGFQAGGIARLLGKASDWANFKEDPPPDGWIKLEVIRGELSLALPSPISQDFVVPEGYEPPNRVFHNELVETIRSSSGGLVTLVGPPGRGKSTYISFLCEQLAKAKIAVARHHYFLSVHDHSGDRLTPTHVARSLLSQVRLVADGKLQGDINVDKVEDLADVLRRCGMVYEAERQPFVVVIDGLDHVWRDNRGDVRPLDELFRQLLPLPENVFLLVGSQPVADDRMPARLIAACPREHWRELPPMSGDAVHGYVMRQVQAGRWKSRSRLEEAEFARCSAVLHERTHGHPLHVIYSVEALLNKTSSPTEYEVRELPDCPGDDIRMYYRTLWQRLSYAQRDVLHLMSTFSFRWPESAFEDISLGHDPGLLTLDGVRHLLFDSGLGLQPFHESLIVFIKEEGEHCSRVEKLRPRVEEWLRTLAPARLRNTWHWLIVAEMGDTEPLRQGLSRNWLLDRLTEGYPVDALVRLLTRAEEIAFAELAFGEAYRHRALKMRLLEGPQYQVDDASRLQRASWVVSSDTTLSQDSFVARHKLATSVLPWLAIALAERADERCARESARYALDRYNSELRLSPGRANRNAIQNRLHLLNALIRCSAVLPPVLAKQLKHMPDWGGYQLVGHLKKTRSLTLLMEVWREPDAFGKRRMLEDAVCEVATLSGANICAWEEFKSFRLSPFAAIVATLRGSPFDSPTASPIRIGWDHSADMEVRRYMFSALVRDWFLQTLEVDLCAQGDFEWLDAPTFNGRENLSNYLDVLATFAEGVAGAFREGIAVPFEAVFEHFSPVTEPTNVSYQKKETFSRFKRALLQVAVDVHLLSTAVGGPRVIEATSWESAKSSPWLDTRSFPEFAVQYGQRVFSNELVRHAVEERAKQAVSELQETCTIAQDLLELCELSILYDEVEVARARCRQAWDITIGYGHRKDPSLDGIVSALEYLREAAPAVTRSLLSRAAPQIANVCHYTDGSGTKHIPERASALLAKLDRYALAKQYEELVAVGEWFEAEDCMKHLLGSAERVTPELLALAKTGLSDNELQRASWKAEAIGPLAAVAMAHQGEPTFLPPTVLVPPPKSEGLFPSETVDFDAFPPSSFRKFFLEISQKKGVPDDTLRSWFLHWKAKGKASVVLKYVRQVALAESDRRTRLRHLLDDLLAVSAELEGASDATFDVAVKAQIDNGGWFPFFFESSEETEARLTKVAELYPERADEFIRLSAKNWLTTQSNPSELIVPGEKLVFFLVQLGRIEEAVDLTQKMVESVVADTSGLVLPPPAWA